MSELICSVTPGNPAIDRRCFRKAGGKIPGRAAPWIKASCSNMTSVAAIFKPNEAVIPPGTGKVDAAVGNAIGTGKIATDKMEAIFLLQAVGRCCHIAKAAGIIHGANTAAVKPGISASEDEIHRAFNVALLK